MDGSRCESNGNSLYRNRTAANRGGSHLPQDTLGVRARRCALRASRHHDEGKSAQTSSGAVYHELDVIKWHTHTCKSRIQIALCHSVADAADVHAKR
jgi:hypothetical protein